MISFDDFKKIDLRVGKIRNAERVEGSEKLLKLAVDIGSEVRQLIAGIGKAYEPESLAGRSIVIVANLEPRIMMGLESQGMLLAASCGQKPVLLAPDGDVPPGSEVR